MIDPNHYRNAAKQLATDEKDYWNTPQKKQGMCVALHDTITKTSFDYDSKTEAEYLEHVHLLEQYFKPTRSVSSYWWHGITPKTQVERFMALHFMALIAEDL